MESVFRREVDYLMEGIYLLQHLGAERKYRELKEEIDRRFGNPLREGLCKMELIERIEAAAERAFSEDMEQVRYYFHMQKENGMCCAGKTALLWEGCRETEFQEVAAYGAYLRGLSEQEYCERFAVCIQEYTAEDVRGEKDIVKIEEPLAVISFLMRMEIADEEKWKLQKIFIEREEQLERVLALLEKAVVCLRGFEPELLAWIQQFCAYWEKELGGQALSVYMGDRTDIFMEENPLGFCLQASFLHPDEIVSHSDQREDGTYEKRDFCRLGILFGEDFEIGIKPARQTEGFEIYVLQVLKLLADKSKFEILSYIRDKEAYGSELARHLGITSATVSHHMNALLHAGLVRVNNRENRMYYTANTKALSEVLDYCGHILT